MIQTLLTRIVMVLGLIAAGGATLFYGSTYLRQAPPVDANRVTAGTVVSPSASGGQDQRLQDKNLQDKNSSAVAAVQVETNKIIAALAGPTGAPAPKEGIRPAFDVARIEPSGDAVIAGRAAPGASVELLRNGTPLDRVVADASGQFAIVPPRLPPGDSELTLRSRQPNGMAATSKESVVVAVQPNLRDQPVVALMAPDKPSVVLSKPAAAGSSSGSVAVDTVEAEPGGKLYVSGRSSPRAVVRLYLNNSYRASTMAAADGQFVFAVSGGIAPGVYQVRLDELAPRSGAIRSRAEVPFSMPQAMAANDSGVKQTVGSSRLPQSSKNPPQIATQDVTGVAMPQQAEAGSGPSSGQPAAVSLPKATTATVSRGDSLWRISRAIYGTGSRYTVIYDANQKQIRNPDRIYPGQVFILPETAR